MLDDPTPRKAIELAVKTEELGAKFYGKMADRFADDEEIAGIFASLAKDERLHRARFEELMQTVPPDKMRGRQERRFQVLKAMSLTEFFMGNDGLYRKLDEIETRDDALARAFELERSTLGYYQALRDVMGDSDVLSEIIEEEKEHLVKVMEYLTTGAKFRGLRDDGP